MTCLYKEYWSNLLSAQKYKLYKLLSKAAAANSGPVASTSASNDVFRSSNPPTTPPRSERHRPSSLLPKSRVVEPTAPLLTFNPFSPQKRDKGKRRESTITATIVSNPFASPIKGKGKFVQRTLSPEPFSPIIPKLSFTLPVESPPPAPASAVSRARKRLRGEPVSPSPNKDKKRRVESQTTLPFPRLNLKTPNDEDDDEDIDEGTAANTSFVDDSPMKAPTTGKSFKLLFEETMPPTSDLFGVSTQSKGPNDLENPFQGSTSSYTNDTEPQAGGSKTSLALIVNGKGSTERNPVPRKASVKSNTLNTLKTEKSIVRQSAKRPLSDDTEIEPDPEILPSKPFLIPPSPPPADTSRRPNTHAKGKGKASNNTKNSRKKAKLADEDIGDDESYESDELPTKIKSFSRTQARPNHADRAGSDDGDLGSDSDPILGYPRFTRPHGRHSPSPRNIQEEGSTFKVDLPDKLRTILALRPARSRDSQEARVVKGLVYGERVSNYDGARGGEIWGVGEDDMIQDGDEMKRDTEGEDDWEGEPVPWELGEL